MEDRERGFIVIHRRVRSSPLYRALTAEQRTVFYTLLLFANWKDGKILVGEVWETVRRGELAHSLKTIAAEAGVSVKVVRTTIGKLATDDRLAGGKGPFLVERWIGSGPRVGTYPGTVTGTIAGTETGTGLRVLTIINYDTYQSITDEAGTGTGTERGTDAGTQGARQGHGRGTNRTKGTIGTIEATTAAAPAAEPLALVPEEPKDPRIGEKRRQWETLFKQERGGEEYRWEGPKDWFAAKKLAPVNAEVFEAKALAGLRGQGYGRCSTLAQLGQKWNDLAGGAGTKPIVTAPAAPRSAFVGGRREL